MEECRKGLMQQEDPMKIEGKVYHMVVRQASL